MHLTDIDTRVGSKSRYEFSHGNTLPLTGVPFGMNYLAVATTDQDTSWWFDPELPYFAGLRITHQPSPWIGDFQAFTMRFKTRDDRELDDYRPQDAIFRPDLIQLTSLSQQLLIRATNDRFGGKIQLTNFSNRPSKLIIEGKKVQLISASDQEVILSSNNFAGSEDPDFTMYTALHGKFGAVKLVTTTELKKIIIVLNDENLTYATSFISQEQAKFNLSQLALMSFSDLHQQVVAAWEEKLNLIRISDHDQNKVKTFYTNLYRSLLFPTQFYEITAKGQEVHYSTTEKKVLPGKMYTNVGFWDVYRTNFPLYGLLLPQEFHDFLEGFLNSTKENGYLPRWLSPDERGMMPGTMLDVLVADAAVKELAPDLLEDYLEGMLKGAESSSKDSKYGREGLEEYKKLGYVSTSYPESVNKTLDYAYSDWAIGQVLQKLGREVEAQKYLKRALNYRNLFNPEIGLMNPKDDQGNFVPINTTDWGNGFTEGSSWQNSFNVFQDVAGLIKLYGSREAFTAQLTKLVNQPALYQVGSYGQVIHEMREMIAQPFGQLAISNQPSFHLPYLFALADAPHQTEILVKQLCTSFNATFAGYPGDEDNGSMSSWYLFSSLGFYPSAPGVGTYIFGIPSFDYVKIALPNEKTLTLITENNNKVNNYVAKRTFNGNKVGQTISQQDLLKGGTLITSLSLLPE